MRHTFHRVAALFLALLSAVLLFLPRAALAAPTEFENALARLETLEQLAKDYRSESRVSTSVDQLMMSYIRARRYSSAAVMFTVPARPAAPDAPQLLSAEAGSLLFSSIENTEYSIDEGASWQESPLFTELTPR